MKEVGFVKASISLSVALQRFKTLEVAAGNVFFRESFLKRFWDQFGPYAGPKPQLTQSAFESD